MDTFLSLYCQRKADDLIPMTLGTFHFSFEVLELTTICVCIFWVLTIIIYILKNKTELWENNNINRIFVGHLYISLILQGSRMAETSNLLGCEMCLMDMWNIPFSMSLFYLVAISEESEQHTAQQMAVIKYSGCQLTLTRREEENEMDTVSFYPCLGEN